MPDADLTPLEGFGDFVRATMEVWKVPGLAVGVVKDGAVIYLEGFGDRDRERSLPGQPDVELVPRRGTEFAVKGLSGYSIEFVRDAAGAVVEALVTQPWGAFTVKRQ